MGRILKPWIRSWPSEEEYHPSDLLAFSKLGVIRTFKAVPVMCAVASILILLKAVPAAAATAAPYHSGFQNMAGSTFHPSDPISFDVGGTMQWLWLVGLGVFLGWTALNVSGPRDVVRLRVLLSSPPQGMVNVMERIGRVNCTCNDQGNDMRIPEDSSKGSPMKCHLQRTFDECVRLYESKRSHELDDAKTVELTLCGVITRHSLEESLANHPRPVRIRPAVISRTTGTRYSTSVTTS
ncbi:MAG: hypothetical protein M1830_007206 [Pleopsidium flavum]|nr:MAG: hypothetical protein M1830_007206 [Pleopsidium flavum]